MSWLVEGGYGWLVEGGWLLGSLRQPLRMIHVPNRMVAQRLRHMEDAHSDMNRDKTTATLPAKSGKTATGSELQIPTFTNPEPTLQKIVSDSSIYPLGRDCLLMITPDMNEA